jgi:hypothetical protein
MESRLPLDGFKQRQPWRVLPAASKNGSLIYPTQWWPVPTARVRTLFHVGTVGGRESIRCTRSGTRPPRSRSGSRAWRPLGSRRRSRAAASRPRGSAESRRFAFARAPGVSYHAARSGPRHDMVPGRRSLCSGHWAGNGGACAFLAFTK